MLPIVTMRSPAHRHLGEDAAPRRAPEGLVRGPAHVVLRQLPGVDELPHAWRDSSAAPTRTVHGERANFTGLVLGCIEVLQYTKRERGSVRGRRDVVAL